MGYLDRVNPVGPIDPGAPEPDPIRCCFSVRLDPIARSRTSLRRLRLPTSPLVSDLGGYVGQAHSFVGQTGVVGVPIVVYDFDLVRPNV
jgi:hypothetical protein